MFNVLASLTIFNDSRGDPGLAVGKEGRRVSAQQEPLVIVALNSMSHQVVGQQSSAAVCTSTFLPSFHIRDAVRFRARISIAG